MKQVGNEKLDLWLKKYRFNTVTLAKEFLRFGVHISSSTVWEWLAKGRVPRTDSMQALDRLMIELKCSRRAEDLFTKK